MSELIVALLTIFGTVASVTTVVLYVFNGTRKTIGALKELIREIHQQGEKRHQEVMENLKQVFELAEKRHIEVMEALKQGFVGLTQQRPA